MSLPSVIKGMQDWSWFPTGGWNESEILLIQHLITTIYVHFLFSNFIIFYKINSHFMKYMYICRTSKVWRAICSKRLGSAWDAHGLPVQSGRIRLRSSSASFLRSTVHRWGIRPAGCHGKGTQPETIGVETSAGKCS